MGVTRLEAQRGREVWSCRIEEDAVSLTSSEDKEQRENDWGGRGAVRFEEIVTRKTRKGR